MSKSPKPHTEILTLAPLEPGLRKANRIELTELVAGEPVSRILFAAPDSAELNVAGCRTKRDDHSSRSRIAPGLKQPTRGSQPPLLASRSIRAGPALPSYLALLHAGFSMPRMLPSGRWALTPPFHPCQMRSTKFGELAVFPQGRRRGASIIGGLFSVALSVAALTGLLHESCSATPWRYQARYPTVALATAWSPDFPPVRPSPASQRTWGKPAVTRLTRRSII